MATKRQQLRVKRTQKWLFFGMVIRPVMAERCHYAQIQSNDGFGSLADIEALRPGRPLIAKSGLKNLCQKSQPLTKRAIVGDVLGNMAGVIANT